MTKKLILITNDDGIDSPLIKRLAEAATRFGEVWIVAPDSQRSAVSQSSTFSRPVRVREYDFGIDDVKAYSCSGTPADCVRLGIRKILPSRTDFVLCGINNGPNISSDIQYSGTLGAAFEGSFLGVQSIAFSLQSGDGLGLVDRYLEELMEECMNRPLPKDTVWNINFPGCSLDECRGIQRDCRVSTDHFYEDGFDEKQLDDGSIEYSTVSHRIWDASEGTDLAALIDRYISVGKVHNVS